MCIRDRVYIEPLTVEVVEQLILKEKPDSVLPTLGGQAGLNLAMELEDAGFLKEHGVRLIGTTALTIKKACLLYTSLQKFYPGALFGGGHRCGTAGPAGAHNDNISQVERPPFYGLTAVA